MDATLEHDLAQRAPRGMPLRFLAAVLMLWIGGRIAASSSLMGDWNAQQGRALPMASTAAGAHELLNRAAGYARGKAVADARPVWVARIDRAPVMRSRRIWVARIDRAPIIHIAAGTMTDTEQKPRQALAENARAPSSSAVLQRASLPALLPPPAASEGEPRWSGSAWLFWRGKGSGAALNGAGQLGAAQAGVRIDRRIARLSIGKHSMPMAVYGRMSAALDTPHQSEAALGIAVQPFSGRASLRVGIERRIALEQSGRNAFAFIAAGGLNPTRVFGPVVAEGYAQAGVVGLSRQDLFADGRLTFGLPLDRAERSRLGFSFSGGAQPNVARLDIGPMIETRLPLGATSPRLVLEWRQRIAGQARPGSGPSVTLASDF